MGNNRIELSNNLAEFTFEQVLTVIKKDKFNATEYLQFMGNLTERMLQYYISNTNADEEFLDEFFDMVKAKLANN